jgi:hypothetical protein
MIFRKLNYKNYAFEIYRGHFYLGDVVIFFYLVHTSKIILWH